MSDDFGAYEGDVTEVVEPEKAEEAEKKDAGKRKGGGEEDDKFPALAKIVSRGAEGADLLVAKWNGEGSTMAKVGYKLYYEDGLPEGGNDKINYLQNLARGYVACMASNLPLNQKHFSLIPFKQKGKQTKHSVVWETSALVKMAKQSEGVAGVDVVVEKDGDNKVTMMTGVVVGHNGVRIGSYPVPREMFEEMKVKYGRNNPAWRDTPMTMWTKTAKRRVCADYCGVNPVHADEMPGVINVAESVDKNNAI